MRIPYKYLSHYHHIISTYSNHPSSRKNLFYPYFNKLPKIHCCLGKQTTLSKTAKGDLRKYYTNIFCIKSIAISNSFFQLISNLD